MFTGIIEAVGQVAALQPGNGDARLYLRTCGLNLEDVRLGDSIAVNGVCLTVVELPGDGFWADVSGESLARTTLGKLRTGDPVNLEKALLPTTRLGGHLVSGHVDGLGTIARIAQDARSVRLDIRAPDALAKYIAEKGSICVDGISLTVNTVQGAVFNLNIVPHTQRMTTLQHARPGQQVNLEVDVLARYVERLRLGEAAAQPENRITPAFLAEHGFA